MSVYQEYFRIVKVNDQNTGSKRMMNFKTKWGQK